KIHFPYLIDRISVGRFAGSDVLRADDDISKDHNWGPQFSLFLSHDDFVEFGEQVSKTMNQHAPEQWLGYHLDGAGDKNVLVENVPNWIRDNIGFSTLPQSDHEWNIIVKHRQFGGTVEGRESALYYLRYGALWLDNNAEFTHWCTVLRKYPQSVWYARLAEECFRIWQYGQYNFVQRVSKRNDPLTISVCLGNFAEGVMRILTLLYRNYTPYWKWLSHEVRQIEQATQYTSHLETLLATNNRTVQVQLVEKICDDIYQELLFLDIISNEGSENSKSDLMPLLAAQLDLLDRVPWLPSIN
ncbi:MAG: DUF4037 domain-containing protein, partial [Chloroflexota bacterium]